MAVVLQMQQSGCLCQVLEHTHGRSPFLIFGIWKQSLGMCVCACVFSAPSPAFSPHTPPTFKMTRTFPAQITDIQYAFPQLLFTSDFPPRQCGMLWALC